MTSAELRSEFDFEYNRESRALDEFAAEPEHSEFRTVAAHGPADVARRATAAEANTADASFANASIPHFPLFASQQPPSRARRWPIFIPLVIGVVAASAWYGLATRDVELPRLPIAPAWWATAEPHVAIPIPQMPDTRVSRDPVAPATPVVPVTPVTPETSDARVTQRAVPRAPEAIAGPTRAAVDEALAAVSRSYRALDASSITGVWPGADVATLSQRFSTLKYQSLSFDGCDVRPAGADQVVASCRVVLATASNSGDPSLRRRQESWSIVFNRSRDRYVIGSVATR